MNYKRYIVLLAGFYAISAYDNLSHQKNAVQSHTSPGTNYEANKAVDSNATTCMRTEQIGPTSPDKTVWWKVDLGAVYNIHSINILFRNYDGEEKRQQGRFAGFSLYVSNDGVIINSSLCYKDGPQLPLLNLTINCMTLGRFVIFFNERVYGVTYPDGYEMSIYTELCEVIVYGCNTIGVYGSNCDVKCPINCRYNTCHILNGTCFGCDPGWIGETCATKCPSGWYGLNCKHQCNSEHCRDDASCYHVTGLCEDGCAAGWKGSLCSKTCDDGRFGFDCASNCSGHCLNDYPCNRETGYCNRGCTIGYIGELCNETCPSQYFGIDCKNQCSRHCFNSTACNYVDGTCTAGCQDGYIGKFCNIKGYYGTNCSGVCSPNCKTCEHTDGKCTCKAGWNGSDCNTECVGSYGTNCTFSCSQQCYNQSCDKVNGSCLTGCTNGFYGAKCDKDVFADLQSISSTPWSIVGPISLGVNFLFIIFVFRLLRRFYKKIIPQNQPTMRSDLYIEAEAIPEEKSHYQELSVYAQLG